MPVFRKKPVTVEAVQWNGRNFGDVHMLAGPMVVLAQNGVLRVNVNDEDMVAVRAGDWIIKGTAGEFYPCAPDVFANVYEAVEE